MEAAAFHISALRAHNYKNLKEVVIQLNPALNCFIGENGSGKTNLLDAIHYLCLTKSMFTHSDQPLVNFDETWFRMECLAEIGYTEKKIYKIEAAYGSEQGKIFKVNQAPYEKLSMHIGRFPLVMIAPDDTVLITDGSEHRRKFFDSILCQMDNEYLQWLMHYNHLLKQRNAHLKKAPIDTALLQVYDTHLIDYSLKIAQVRQKFCTEFQAVFYYKYQYISNEKEKTTLVYNSAALKPDFEERYRAAISKDIAFERTTMGVHTDDYDFFIENKSVKKTASQGQKKSFLIALKLTQFEIMKAQKGITPLLLLDDIFDKLDDIRMQKLIKLVASHAFGQVFVTDARPERCQGLFAHLNKEVSFFTFSSRTPHATQVSCNEY